MAIAAAVIAAAGAFFGCVSVPLPMKDEIRLEGVYSGHLQDVWYDGVGHIYWAHTRDLVKTDLDGRVLRRVRVDGHHAGIEVRNGRAYVAVCAMQNTTGGKTTPNCRVTIGEYDAETLELVEMHVTDIRDRSGSLAILDDGTFLVGCLRPKDIRSDQVRFHHIGRDYRLIRSYTLDDVPVRLGIEVIKRQDDGFVLCMYGVGKDREKLDFNCIRLDRKFREVWRGRLDGACGLIRDGGNVWIGKTVWDKSINRYKSRLVKVRTGK